jgi:hypothetical protein
VYFYCLRTVLISVLGSCSGILRATRFQFEWLHSNFREYLAVDAFSEYGNDGDVRALLSKVKDEAWS